jgi:hypothetical protein
VEKGFVCGILIKEKQIEHRYGHIKILTYPFSDFEMDKLGESGSGTDEHRKRQKTD